MTVLAQRIDTSGQLGLLDWKGTEREHHLVTEGDGPSREVQRLRREVPHGEHQRDEDARVDLEARRLGPRSAEVDEDGRRHEAERLLLELHAGSARGAGDAAGGGGGAQAEARRGAEGEGGGARGGEEAQARAQELRIEPAEGPQPQAVRSGVRFDLLTLGGFRPGTGFVVLPGVPALWWKPCLKREEGSARAHCWFLAPTTHDSWYCWTCKSELGL